MATYTGVEKIKIGSDVFELATGGDSTVTTWYGTCGTTASTAAKVVTCSNFVLTTGAIIGILFTTANTAATPTLNVNSTGAKSIYIGSSTPSSTTNVLKWSANTMLYFMYDGTYFRFITAVAAASVVPPTGANTWYGTSSTGATTAAKTSTIDNYVLTKGAVVSITFSTANTYSAGAITLNVNSTGAKTIYYNNAATSTTNLLPWDAGETLTFIYSGSYYYFAGKTKAYEAAATTAYTSANVKNIIESTNAPGTTSAPTGTVWLQYGATPPSDRADYVVEQGTSGIWTYRKWNSGISECWAGKTLTGINVNTAWGNVYYGTVSTASGITFPSNLFIAAPVLQFNLKSAGGRFWSTYQYDSSATNVGTIYAIAPQSYTNQTIDLYMYGVGSWK